MIGMGLVVPSLEKYGRKRSKRKNVGIVAMKIHQALQLVPSVANPSS